MKIQTRLINKVMLILSVLLSIIFYSQLHAETYEFETTWGNSGIEEGEFNNPRGIAIDSDEYIYVADSNNNRIQKFSSNGTFIKKWGSCGAGDGEFDFPVGIAIDNTGNVYVVDTKNYRVQKFNSDGDFLGKWSSSGYSITINNAGLIYVADYNNGKIQSFNLDGDLLSEFWNTGGTATSNPVSCIDADSEGNLYLLQNCIIKKYNSIGVFIKEWGDYGSEDGDINYAKGLSIDSADKIYVADSNNDRVQVFDKNGNFLTKWGTSGTGESEFDYITKVGVDNIDSAYVLDSVSNRVQKFRDMSKVRLSGYVKNADGEGIENSTVTLSGGVTEAYLTASNGYYEFKGLAQGDYIIEVKRDNYRFEISSKTYIGLSADQTNQDFIGARPTVSFFGHIKDASNYAITGSTIKVSGMFTKYPSIFEYDEDGYYELLNTESGAVSFYIENEDYNFSPDVRGYSLFNEEPIGADSVRCVGWLSEYGYPVIGTRDIQIKLYDQQTGGMPVWAQFFNSIVISSGNYVIEFTPSEIDWEAKDYWMEETVDGLVKMPRYKITKPHHVMCIGQDFIGAEKTYSINGHLKDSLDYIIQGATVTLSGSADALCITNSEGYYEFTNLIKGDYTITPVYEHVSAFNYPSVYFSELNSDQTQDFIGAPKLYVISGCIKNEEDVPIEGVLVSALIYENLGDPNPLSCMETVTNEQGYYELGPVAYSYSYIVQPYNSDYCFIPNKHTYVTLNGDQENQGFSAYRNGTMHTTDGTFDSIAVSTGSILWRWLDPEMKDEYNIFDREGNLIADDTNIISFDYGVVDKDDQIKEYHFVYYIEDNLSPNTTYERYFEGYNVAGTSTTALMSVYTLANDPTDLQIKAYSAHTADIEWQGNGCSKYKIEVSSNDTVLNTYESTINEYRLTGLIPNTAYSIKVWGYNGDNILTMNAAFTQVTTAELNEKIINPNTGGKQVKQVMLDGKSRDIIINIPAGAIQTNDEVYIDININPLISSSEAAVDKIQQAEDKIIEAGDIQKGSIAIELNMYKLNGERLNQEFLFPVTITIPYLDENQDGVVDNTDIYEKNLNVYLLDENLEEWILQGGIVDEEQNTITLALSHFSVYTVFGAPGAENDLSKAIVYPNPYKPGTGGDYDREGGVLFDKLTKRAKIRIYTIAGELVYEGYEEDGDGKFEWKAENNANQRIASGVYIYIITNLDNESEKSKGKIAVIR
ncbi:MAG: carboxypeptidase regulatory-like domain-containing protein [Elusimicrobiota bacterium]